jgi:hypothetical protein
MRKVAALVLVVCAVAAPAAASESRPAGARQILATDVLSGPAASETRLAWVHGVAKANCSRMAVRDAVTLRRLDLGTPACDDPTPTVGPAAWGAGVGLWTTTTCGNKCYENVHVVGARGRTWGAAPDSEVGYVTYPHGDGWAVAATEGSDTALVYSVLHRELVDDTCGFDADASCDLAITGGALWSFVAGHWRKLSAPWPVGALDVSRHSIAIAQARGPEVQIRDLRTWKLERSFRLAGVVEVALAPHFVAARSTATVAAYRRPGGGLYLRRSAPRAQDDEHAPARTLALSDLLLAFGVASRGGEAIDVFRGDGSTLAIRDTYPAGLVVTGRRVTWQDAGTLFSQVLQAS